MASLEVRDLKNVKVGEFELDDAVFGAKPKSHVVYEEVKRYLASLRSGTHSTKTKGMVSGGGKKPWKQKGTGRARAGSNRSPLWRGGGVVHGPHPHLYDLKMNRKAKKLAMRVVLTQKLGENQITVVDSLSLPEGKTKHIKTLVADLGVDRRALIVDGIGNEALRLAARNHPMVKVVSASALSVYDVLRHKRLILTRETAAQIQEIFRP